jgi:hypothetical protein
VSESDPQSPARPFEKDVEVNKPGIVGARWWHQSLMDEDRAVQRRHFLVSLTVAGGAIAAMSAFGVGVFELVKKESTSLGLRNALGMQRLYGWDFGARGAPLVFDGVAEGPFLRESLSRLAWAVSPWEQGPNAKYYVATLIESVFATPTATLPDPEDGRPAPDSAPFKRLSDVLLPVVTPAMKGAYGVGEAVARLAGLRRGLAVLVDLPGPEAVAFAAGAADRFEPVLLLDNWPHPHGVVPSHMTLAALAYYQPRFASQKKDASRSPLFVLDRSRLNPYSEEVGRFDNRYYARMPKLSVLAKDGIRSLLYVVSSPSALPEPADLKLVLAPAPAGGGSEAAGVQVQALALTDFASDPASAQPERFFYGGSARKDPSFQQDYAFGPRSAVEAQRAGSPATHEYGFLPASSSPSLARVGEVAVVVAASGLILSAALDRRGSMNRFAGGWSG